METRKLKTLEEEVKEMKPEDWRTLQHRYVDIMSDPTLLLQLANLKNVGIDEAYAACKEKVLYYGRLLESVVPKEGEMY